MIRNKYEHITTIIFLIFSLIFILGLLTKIFLPSHPIIEKIKYCKIDSFNVIYKNEFSPELLTKYYTECNIIFSSNKEYYIGDSIEVKTIIIE